MDNRLPELFSDANLRELVLPYPARAISLLVLKDPCVLIGEEIDPELDLYWSELWPAAVVLADAILSGDLALPDGPEPVLDVGCGTGLVSLAVALRAQGRLRVVAADRETRALELAAENARRNGVAEWMETLPLDWRKSYAGRHRLILAADCLYHPDAGWQLSAFLREALLGDDPSSRAVVVDPDRWCARNFGLLARQAGFNIRTWTRQIPFTASQGPVRGLRGEDPITTALQADKPPLEATFYELTL